MLFQNVNAGFYIFIAAYIIIAIIHLYFCFRMIPKYRKITKPLCMLFLGTAFLFLSPQTYLLWLSCYFSMFGDIFLIKNKQAFDFVFGAIIFAVAHTLNAINQLSILSYTLEPWIYVVVAIIIIIIGLVMALITKKGKKAIGGVGASYACFHIINIIIATLLIIDGKVNYIIFVLLGYIIYVCSDFIVNYVTNKHDIPRRDFYIMITYLLGQTGIYFGLALTL